MRDELQYIGEKIIQNDQMIARNIIQLIDTNLTMKISESGDLFQKGVDLSNELIRLFGEALFNKSATIPSKVTEWAMKSAEIAIRINFSLTDSLRAISYFRTIIWDVFTEELEQRQFSAITMLDVSKIIDPLLDEVNSIIGEVYESHTNKIMKLAYSAVEELSVPVVPISEGIAVVPLVGSIDTHRARLVMDIALHEGARLRARHMIFDVSGVPIIDTMVADQLFQIVRALRLTGVEAIITGIRPEISQTIVTLGLNFNAIKTRASMHQALRELGFKQDVDKK